MLTRHSPLLLAFGGAVLVSIIIPFSSQLLFLDFISSGIYAIFTYLLIRHMEGRTWIFLILATVSYPIASFVSIKFGGWHFSIEDLSPISPKIYLFAVIIGILFTVVPALTTTRSWIYLSAYKHFIFLLITCSIAYLFVIPGFSFTIKNTLSVDIPIGNFAFQFLTMLWIFLTLRNHDIANREKTISF